MTTMEIAAEHGVSRQSIHTYRRTGAFPQPVEGEGSTRVRFRADEVAAFFAANPKQPGKKRDLPDKPQGEPVTTTIDARSDLYAFAMRGKEHSPDNSERASEKIDAYRAAVLREVANSLAALGPVDSLVSGPEAWNEAVTTLRRMADEAGAQDG